MIQHAAVVIRSPMWRTARTHASRIISPTNFYLAMRLTTLEVIISSLFLLFFKLVPLDHGPTKCVVKEVHRDSLPHYYTISFDNNVERQTVAEKLRRIPSPAQCNYKVAKESWSQFFRKKSKIFWFLFVEKLHLVLVKYLSYTYLIQYVESAEGEFDDWETRTYEDLLVSEYGISMISYQLYDISSTISAG